MQIPDEALPSIIVALVDRIENLEFEVSMLHEQIDTMTPDVDEAAA